MDDVKFDLPVSIFLGLGFPRKVERVLDAYDILIEWNGIPDLDRSGAMEVCRKALNDERTGKDAREAFQRFALKKGILADEVFSRAASALAQEWFAPR
jgi:hypothetical protein